MGLENSCRLCLKDLSDVRLNEEGYLEVAQHRDLQYMVLDCFDILISDDEIVTKVCSGCNDDVRYVTLIRKKVKNADSEIRKFYAQVEVKEELDILDVLPQQKEDLEESIIETEDASTLYESNMDPKIEMAVDDNGSEKRNTQSEVDLEEVDLFNKYDFMEVGADETEDETNLDEPTEISAAKVKIVYRKKVKNKLVKDRFFDFRCYICSTDFTSHAELLNHLPTHIESTPKVCHICNQVVSTVRNYNNHLRRIHFRIGKAIPCDECSKMGIVREYSSNHTLQAHIKSVHEGIAIVPEKKFVCTYCGSKFSRSSGLRMHENRHTKAIMYKCNRCSMSFTTKSSLIRHDRVHTAEKPFKCDQCDAAFSQSNLLNQHKEYRHSDERPYGCDICGDSVRFKNKYVLRTHMKSHETTGQGPTLGRAAKRNRLIERSQVQRNLKCDFCPAVYYKELFLCQHILDKHPSEKVPMIQCELCKAKDKERYFLTQTEADSHAEYHAMKDKVQDKERKCVDCGEICKNSLALQHHRDKHKDHKCIECGKDFKTPRSMRRHFLTVHLQERPFKCDQCDSAYGQLIQLTAHLKTHNRT